MMSVRPAGRINFNIAIFSDTINMWVCMRKAGILFFFSFEKIIFQQNWWVLKERDNMQQKTKQKNKNKLHYLRQMWFYLCLTHLILAWNSTKSAPLNGHHPKLQFPIFIWFSHARSRMINIKLCMVVVLIELYPLSVTLIVFQDHSNVRQFQLKMLCSYRLNWNFVRLVITSFRSWIYHYLKTKKLLICSTEILTYFLVWKTNKQ